MGDYYNATRGPLPATLVDGSAVSFSPKTYQYIPPENEGSASILKLLAKGFLVRSKVPITVPKDAPVDVPPAEKLAGAEKPVTAEKPAADVQLAEKPIEAAKAIEPKVEASTSSMKEEFGKKKR